MVDLGRDLERDAGALGDLDGAVRALFRRDAPEERQVVAAGRAARTEAATQAARAAPCPANWRTAAACAGGRRSTPAGSCGQRQYAPARSFRSSRPCNVVTVRSAMSSKIGKCSRSTWKCSTSNSSARRPHIVQHGQVCGEVAISAAPDPGAWPGRVPEPASPACRASALANSVTSWPKLRARRTGRQRCARCLHTISAGRLRTAVRSGRFSRLRQTSETKPELAPASVQSACRCHGCLMRRPAPAAFIRPAAARRLHSGEGVRR